MKFTVIFPSHESCDFAYGLIFVPSPVWVQGNQHIISLNPERPDYQLGSVKKLMEKEKISQWNKENVSKCIIVVHEEGHAMKEDLKTLKKDLKNEGFNVQSIQLSSRKLFI